MKMTETKQLKEENLDSKLNSEELRNVVEVPIDESKSVIYEARIYEVEFNKTGLMGKAYLSKKLEETALVKLGKFKKKLTPKVESIYLWKLNPKFSSTLTHEDKPVQITEKEKFLFSQNYKTNLINEGLKRGEIKNETDRTGMTHYDAIIIPQSLLEEIFAPIDKKLVEIYKTILQ